MAMIEKLAEIIAQGVADDKPSIDIARAAIEAMREPTEPMKQAAARGVSDSFHEEGFQEGDDPHLWNEFVKAGECAFENAIDAALSEK